ncbi:leucine--tRNA ligase [Buchnera aphidicola]|uniref:leucine--tRNA ligase n=1 Tax=Buchnera aphidicola TaxID=9 RepID=UPI0034643B7E
MKKTYQPEEIEKYVQNIWNKNNTFKVTENKEKEKYYCLAMLPYPSGNLHMGHVRNYTISDVIARYQRMLGKNVLHPMGWDAFGLPAEETAIKNNISPKLWTYKNIKKMKQQLQSLGFSYDWSREINTCEPNFYRWEQWFFTKLYKKKLVYKKISFVNWCPADKTVLANEQVINGCCWRCNTKITLRNIPQWFIKTKKYAEELLNNIEKLKYWPKKVRIMQKNWIGRSEGLDITFNIVNSKKKLIVFTTKPDLIMEATYISISPFHEFTQKLAKKNQEIKKFIKKSYEIMNSKSLINSIQNLGKNTERYVIHPLTKTLLPIWINNYLLIDNIVNETISIPSHNKNDLSFAIQYKLKIKPISNESNYFFSKIINHNTIKKKELLNLESSNNLKNKKNTLSITDYLIKKRIAQKKINYKLKDWTVSRQRYWGTPIPMATNKKNEIIPIPDDQLPIVLPEKNTVQEIQNFLKKEKESNQININGQSFFQETDTFDTFMESSWYYVRYTDPNFNAMVNTKAADYWLPIDQYVGGIEHATMHLIYIRLYHKLLRDFGLVNNDEPIKKLLCQGMVLADAFYFLTEKNQRHWVSPKSVQVKRDKHGKIIQAHTKNGKKITYAGMIKMSKSKNNGIEPELIIKKYGADTVRLFIMFAAPVDASLEWRESGIKGIHRFLHKLWKLIYHHVKQENTDINLNPKLFTEKQKKIRCKLHKTIIKVSDDINRRQTFNTAIAAIMELVNNFIKKNKENEQDTALMQEALTIIIKMLYPFTPHFSFFTWQILKKNSNIPDEILWPVPDKEAILETSNIIAIQINGKTRCKISININCSKEQIFTLVKQNSLILKFIKNKKINKIIYIPRKILNLVISENIK